MYPFFKSDLAKEVVLFVQFMASLVQDMTPCRHGEQNELDHLIAAVVGSKQWRHISTDLIKGQLLF
jgi:hypothetical protein